MLVIGSIFFTANIILWITSWKYNKYILSQIHENLYTLLDKSIRVFEDTGIFYFATGGTLLGAYREQKLISHDDDIDIGIMSEDFLKIIATNKFKQLMKEHGLILIMSGNKLAHRIYFESSPYNVFIDIFEYVLENEQKNVLLDNRQRTKWPNDFYYTYELYPLKMYHFGKLMISCPNEPRPYLNRIYGKWWIPCYTHNHIEQIIKVWNWYDYILINYYHYICIPIIELFY